MKNNMPSSSPMRQFVPSYMVSVTNKWTSLSFMCRPPASLSAARQIILEIPVEINVDQTKKAVVNS